MSDKLSFVYKRGEYVATNNFYYQSPFYSHNHEQCVRDWSKLQTSGHLDIGQAGILTMN